MADDNVTIWGSGLKFGRKPANGELLIGDGVGFELANLSAGSGVTISNTAGGIQISATGSGGTVTGVTATSPLSSSGGATPDISLTGTVAVNRGGTGAATLALNNVILGNGTSAVQTVAPGANGNVLTSTGTTWTSAASSSYFAKGNMTNGTATLATSGLINVASVVRSSTSTYTVTFTTAAANATYTVVVSLYSGSSVGRTITSMVKSTGSFSFTTYHPTSGVATTVEAFDFVVFA
jgi:hypothetical protein